ncbi:CPBP family intramembrane glutamic endopeptidase [Flavobacterium nitrogenifigens]|uniref:CAAX protease self-immunity n=1 Tax=Flavobacterium nitrogenifigens TaxID=1617283 RepID=A0A521F6F1_9FLAO|nr:CPBP family intramembrane glutamic endopeptidase [Flavobacterium nitrogenifigens]KAF2336693.1 CPBP family intramembrane metalloprotease [Flavobacterium nitrogenifigens]SMO91201.1 CAAX protease self-immunity [Flavobacterium nitrogenifigens]
MKNKINFGSIIVFYVVAVICRYAAVKTNLLSGIENPYLVILLRGAGPALGAFAAIKIFSLHNPMSLKGIYKNAIVPFAVYWILPAVLIAGVYYLTIGKFPILLMFTVLAYGLLEEIGWRGFLQEQLKSLPKFTSILIITVLWFAWHLNLEITPNNMIFLGIIFFGTWGIGKVYSSTGSLLAVAGVHSLNNFFRDGLHSTELTLIAILLLIWVGFIILYNKKFKTVANPA